MAEIELTGDAVEVGVGDEVVIRLPEHASPGYLWSVRSIGDGLELVEDTTEPSEVVADGAAGERTVRVRATAATRADVVLRLARPWQPEPAQERRIVVVAHDR